MPAYSPKFWLSDQQVYAGVRFQEPPPNLRKRMARYARNHDLWIIVENPSVRFEDELLESEYVIHRLQFPEDVEDQKTRVTGQVH